MKHPGFLYIVSWEVANRLGGVHTVLETSASHVKGLFGRDLLYIGPDLWVDRAEAAFEEDPVQPEIAGLSAERDVPVRFGRWMVDGGPRCALVHFGRLLERRNEILGELWNQYGVDSIAADWDTVERILFGYAVGRFIEMHYHAAVRPRARRAVAHFHQWTSGAGLLYLTTNAPEIGTVYTPHGTTLGRGLGSSGVSPAEYEAIDALAAAKERNIEAQHTVEAGAVKNASVLTTVSEQVAEESAHLLGRRPEIITPNGYQSEIDSDPVHRSEVRAAVLRTAERFLGTPLDPDKTRIAICSGRYEFRNKGLGIALAALGRLRERGDALPRNLLFLIFVPASQTGLRREVTRRLKTSELAGSPCGICTHNLAHPESDLILEACKAAALENAVEDNVHVVFAPVMLSRRDPLFPYNYIDVLRASDFSVFPSLYEPWGYTPVESLDAGVPTITTDLTGFGHFVATLPAAERDAITVLPASVTDEAALEVALESEFARFLERSDEEMEGLRRRGDAVVERMSWSTLLAKTIEAYDLALHKAAGRRSTMTRPGASRISRRSVVSLPARSELSPRLHRFSVSAALPVRIARLEELARNLWWAWTPRARALFESIDADALADAGSNPVRFIGAVNQERLEEAAQDEAFLAEYDAVLETFDDYRARPKIDAPQTAYFCAEFALHESLPIYSGGLGVLAGDHLKSASDCALPLVAIGLRYAEGYFHQVIEPDGSQGVAFRSVDPREVSLTEVVGADGKPLRITLTMPERELVAAVWRADVGQVPLFLLDTLLGENDPADREITNRLYPSEREPRLQQEILLGIGGWRLLKALDLTPDVCHLNEGHSAFVLLDRLLDLVEGEGLTFAEAQEVVRASTVFTTHTPVPAGHDRFPEDLMRRFFGRIAERLGLDWEEFLALGLASSYEREFSMTNLALHLAGRANGVSRLHGDVARRLHSDVWPGFHTAEAPLESVTNGVHLATWIGPEMRALYESSLDPAWATSDPAALDWTKLESVDDTELWDAHLSQKRRMLEFVRASCEATALRRGENATSVRERLEGLDENALVIGYARRFAPYKRATMIFRDRERLAAILDNTEMPVRLIFAGKSHPDDREGAELVREIVEFATDKRFAGRVFFVEDYGMEAGRHLVQGVDVWLNTPTRPLEASGTSGMKACANGVPHLSVLDGWWCEAHNGSNGWVIGNEDEFDNPDVQAERDSRALYGLLESEVAPLYFGRAGWIEIMKRTLATVPGKFNTHRMVADYLNSAYRPLGQRVAQLSANEFNDARVLAARHMWLKSAWTKVRIEEISVTDLSSRSIALGEVFEVGARVQLGDLKPDDVAVELYVGLSDPSGDLKEPVVIELILNDHDGDGVAEYSGAYMPRKSGAFNYGVRVRPAVESTHEAAALGLVRWA